MIYGKLEGLVKRHANKLEKLESRRSSTDDVVSIDFAKALCDVASNINRQVGVILDRAGTVEYVILGDHERLVIPLLDRFKLIPGRLRGLRLVHTHINDSPLTDDDLTDLALLRLDSITLLNYDKAGKPKKMQTAFLMPPGADSFYSMLDDTDPYNQLVNYHEFIEALDDEITAKTASLNIAKDGILAVITGHFKDKQTATLNLDELEELAKSADIQIIDRLPQSRGSIHPKYIVGPGRLQEIVISALSKGAEYLIFDNILSPSQARSITEYTELKIIDRTQLILDIFAKRAVSNEGKIRVELAQLRYILPRLSTRDDSLSRLSGGIGGRGPGETKLEIDKRRVTDRIAFLSEKLETIEKARGTQRQKRKRNEVPVVSIVGYTNAGKSTLLNNLTKSTVYADNKMFATLDTSSKRIRFPKDRDVIITDTVGFIRDLPTNLAGAFKSTLEEIGEADLFIHLVDVSDPHYKKHMVSVEKVLEDMQCTTKERITVFNKVDLITEQELRRMENEYPRASFINAKDKTTFRTMLEGIQFFFFKEKLELENLELEIVDWDSEK